MTVQISICILGTEEGGDGRSQDDFDPNLGHNELEHRRYFGELHSNTVGVEATEQDQGYHGDDDLTEDSSIPVWDKALPSVEGVQAMESSFSSGYVTHQESFVRGEGNDGDADKAHAEEMSPSATSGYRSGGQHAGFGPADDDAERSSSS